MPCWLVIVKLSSWLLSTGVTGMSHQPRILLWVLGTHILLIVEQALNPVSHLTCLMYILLILCLRLVSGLNFIPYLIDNNQPHTKINKDMKDSSSCYSCSQNEPLSTRYYNRNWILIQVMIFDLTRFHIIHYINSSWFHYHLCESTAFKQLYIMIHRYEKCILQKCRKSK